MENATAFWSWVNLFVIAALGNMTGQDLMQRIFASKSEQVARRACYIAGVVYILFGAIPVLLGLAANLLVPEQAQVQILPALAGLFLSPVLAVVFIVALVSAVLSTIDSAILAPASVLSQNVFSRWTRMPLLKLNRLAVLLVAGCSLGMGYVAEWEHFLEGIDAIGSWQLPTSLTATILAAMAYLICEPPWRMQPPFVTK